MIEFESLRQCVQRQHDDLSSILSSQNSPSITSTFQIPFKSCLLSEMQEEETLKHSDQDSTLFTASLHPIFVGKEIQNEGQMIAYSKTISSQSQIVSQQLSHSEDSYQVNVNSKKGKKINKEKKESYPTKNFLQTFRGPFLNYLRPFFNSKQFQQFEVISHILNKKGINLKDFENLLNFPQFKPHLEEYFRTKRIERDLTMSRVQQKTKKIYFLRIHVFEDAFRTGVFKKINY